MFCFSTKLKGEIDNSTIIVGDFNTPLFLKDRITRHKSNKEIKDLNNIINQLILTDILEHAIQQQQNINYSQEHMEQSLA